MASRLSNNLRDRLKFLAAQLKRTAQDLAPSHLKEFIETSVFQRGETVIIEVRVDTNADPAEKYGSKDARAQEFGSGIRAQIGEQGWIYFGARNAKALVFPGTNEWEGKTIWMPKPRQVRSPGIYGVNEGRGYIRPAVMEMQGPIIEQFDAAIRDDVDFEVHTWFPHAKGERRP